MHAKEASELYSRKLKPKAIDSNCGDYRLRVLKRLILRGIEWVLNESSKVRHGVLSFVGQYFGDKLDVGGWRLGGHLFF